MAYTIESSYKPLTFQELATPYMMYKDAYDKQEEKLEDLYDKTNVFNDLDDLPEDSKARKIYDNYMNDLNKANNDFATNGLTMNNRGLYDSIRKRYQGEIGRLAQAKTKADEINKMRMTQSMQDSSMIYSNDYIGIDDLLGNKKPNMFGISGRYLYDLGSKAGATSSSRIWSNVDIKNTANKYYLLASQTNGYTPEMLAKMRSDFMSIPEFRKEVENAMQANGVTKNLSGDKYNQAALNFVNGFVDSCTFKRNDSLQQNPGVLNAAQEESKNEFYANKEMQERQFDAQMQVKGLVKQKDKSYKYDPSQDADLQKAKAVAEIKAQSKGNNGNSRGKAPQARGGYCIVYDPKTKKHTVKVLDDKKIAQLAKGSLSDFGSLNPNLQNIVKKGIVRNGDPNWYTYIVSEDGNQVWIKSTNIVSTSTQDNVDDDGQESSNTSNSNSSDANGHQS